MLSSNPAIILSCELPWRVRSFVELKDLSSSGVSPPLNWFVQLFPAPRNVGRGEKMVFVEDSIFNIQCSPIMSTYEDGIRLLKTTRIAAQDKYYIELWSFHAVGSSTGSCIRTIVNKRCMSMISVRERMGESQSSESRGTQSMIRTQIYESGPRPAS